MRSAPVWWWIAVLLREIPTRSYMPRLNRGSVVCSDYFPRQLFVPITFPDNCQEDRAPSLPGGKQQEFISDSFPSTTNSLIGATGAGVESPLINNLYVDFNNLRLRGRPASPLVCSTQDIPRRTRLAVEIVWTIYAVLIGTLSQQYLHRRRPKRRR
jgi:hypothetical protein